MEGRCQLLPGHRFRKRSRRHLGDCQVRRSGFSIHPKGWEVDYYGVLAPLKRSAPGWSFASPLDGATVKLPRLRGRRTLSERSSTKFYKRIGQMPVGGAVVNAAPKRATPAQRSTCLLVLSECRDRSIQPRWPVAM